MKVAIHQPEYFPWLGFLDKARRADVLVFLDDVQFDRSSLQHRAKVAGANGVFWLTIPFVHRHPQRIDELAFADGRWAVKHWKSLQAAYGRAPGWSEAAGRLEGFFARPWPRVVDATCASAELLFDVFGARPARVVRASELGIPGDKGELVLAICRAVGASVYLSGRTGATYLDGAAFSAAGIEIQVQRFVAPPIPRARPLDPEEARGLSALDAWLHLGAAAPSLLAPAADGKGDQP